MADGKSKLLAAVKDEWEIIETVVARAGISWLDGVSYAKALAEEGALDLSVDFFVRRKGRP